MYVLLIFAAVLLSFSTAYYAINLSNKTSAGVAEIEEIQKYKREFEKKGHPIIEIDLSSMYPSRRFSQLLQPQNAFSREPKTLKTYFSKSCSTSFEKMSKLYYDKSETWEDFRCNRITRLPAGFFENPPLVHESGVSYAFLAFLSGREPFYTNDWVRSNLNLFHVYELIELHSKSLEGNFKILAQLNRPEIEALVKGSLYILTDDYLLVRNRKSFNVTYKVFTKFEFEDFLKEKIYFLRPFEIGEQCFYREDHFCWEKDDRSLVKIFKQSSLVVFGGSVVVLILITLILYRKIKQQEFEEERKKHALRVLTHELRTPIANLMLQVEEINKQSDVIPATVLEEFLKMEGEVYRLKRLAEKSTSYLQTNDGKSLLAITLQEVPSVNELIIDMIHDYTEKGVGYVASLKDGPFKMDVYWFGICVKNLLENALHHGKNPVVVRWTLSEDILTLSVTDAGVCPYKKLDEILNSDRTGKNSRGLGLGMSIVQKIMQEMDGKLTYQQTPTTFSLFLRNK
jgi:two-component sensor histidine kinase